MLKIVSTIERRVPAATTAPNDEPYSTRRRSLRSYQTRCGIRCTSGWPPVAIDDAQTGVSEGKVESGAAVGALRGEKRERRSARRARPRRSNTDGVRPSMTISTSFLVPATQSFARMRSPA